jgi:hypothetical protein
MFYTTLTNDGDESLSKIIILIKSQAHEFDLDTTSLRTYLDRGLKGSIWIDPWMVVAITSIDRSSERRIKAPMRPPPPSRAREVTTT